MRYIERPEIDMIGPQQALDKTSGYKSVVVKRYLHETYKGICAYCETEVEVSNYYEIEHYLPQSHYPTFKQDIHNLHLSCKRCNLNKRDTTEKMLSPNYYLEDPSQLEPQWKISNPDDLHNKIRYCGHILYSPQEDDAANNSIRILGLNNSGSSKSRGELIESRLRVYSMALGYITIILSELCYLPRMYDNTSIDTYKEIFDHSVETTVNIAKDSLLSMMRHGAIYSQMIIDNFSEPLRNSIVILSKLSPSDIHLLSDSQREKIFEYTYKMSKLIINLPIGNENR